MSFTGGFEPLPGISLYTLGMITRQSSPVFMNPSNDSCLCWLNWTFYPIYRKSKIKGGSLIIIFNAISPNFEIKSIIWPFNSSLSLSAIARTCCIFCICYSQNFLLIIEWLISLQLLWYFFLRTFPMLRSSLWEPLAIFREFSTGQKCFSIADTTCGKELLKKYTTPSRLSSDDKTSKKTSWQSHL